MLEFFTSEFFLTLLDYIIELFPTFSFSNDIINILHRSDVKEVIGRVAYFLPLHDMAEVTFTWLGLMLILFIAMKIKPILMNYSR